MRHGDWDNPSRCNPMQDPMNANSTENGHVRNDKDDPMSCD